MKFNRKKFFDGFRERLDSTISQEQVDGIDFLLKSFENEPLWKDARHIAYALATVFHETAFSFQPVEEGYYLGSKARVQRFQKTLRYYPYFGRGYVQLTWETKRIPNYSKASKRLGIDFVKHPELVMEPINAFKIMTFGMFEGWFTTKKLSDFIKGSKCDYVNARTIVNGHDKAGVIAGYARSFEIILRASNSGEDNSTTTATGLTPLMADLPIKTDEPAASSPETSTTVEQTVVKANATGAVSTTVTQEQNVVIEASEPQGFISKIWKKITGISIFNGGLNGVSDYAQQVSAFGLTSSFWERVILIAAVASIMWLLYEGYAHWSKKREDREKDRLLASVNSTPANTVEFASGDILAALEQAGYKVIRRS